MIYYTADLHLGHANVIRHCDRPFDDVEEMDAALIENWNRRVKDKDQVYIIGDLIFRNSRPAPDYLNQLKGRKVLITGNHDAAWMKKVSLFDYFEGVETMLTIKDKSRTVTLCHYPMMTWPGVGTGGYMVYGHIHTGTHMIFWPLIEASDRMLNAGVDINDFKPATLEELTENNNRFKMLHAPGLPPLYLREPGDIEDFNTVAGCALRYAIGRRTYMPDLVASFIKRHADSLSRREASVMIRDIEEARDRNTSEEDGQPGYHSLGDKCDEETWLDLLDFLKKWLEAHPEEKIIRRIPQ